MKRPYKVRMTLDSCDWFVERKMTRWSRWETLGVFEYHSHASKFLNAYLQRINDADETI